MTATAELGNNLKREGLYKNPFSCAREEFGPNTDRVIRFSIPLGSEESLVRRVGEHAETQFGNVTILDLRIGGNSSGDIVMEQVLNGNTRVITMDPLKLKPVVINDQNRIALQGKGKCIMPHLVLPVSVVTGNFSFETLNPETRLEAVSSLKSGGALIINLIHPSMVDSAMVAQSLCRTPLEAKNLVSSYGLREVRVAEVSIPDNPNIKWWEITAIRP